eukprot:scaffold2318_cov396-Prasinococcus_capsulatus_cf.AAC.12
MGGAHRRLGPPMIAARAAARRGAHLSPFLSLSLSVRAAARGPRGGRPSTHPSRPAHRAARCPRCGRGGTMTAAGGCFGRGGRGCSAATGGPAAGWNRCAGSRGARLASRLAPQPGTVMCTAQSGAAARQTGFISCAPYPDRWLTSNTRPHDKVLTSRSAVLTMAAVQQARVLSTCSLAQTSSVSRCASVVRGTPLRASVALPAAARSQAVTVAREAAWAPGSEAPAHLDGSMAGDFVPSRGSGSRTCVYSRRARTCCESWELAAGHSDKRNVRDAVARLLLLACLGIGTCRGARRFDPLYLGADPAKLKWYREAELQHARWAMLATAGILAENVLRPDVFFYSAATEAPA